MNEQENSNDVLKQLRNIGKHLDNYFENNKQQEQEIFDTVAKHILKQGKPAVVGYDGQTGACKYLTEDGLKCAVGCLIPEDAYDPNMEGNQVDTIVNDFDTLSFLKPHLSFLCDLQTAHDNSGNGINFIPTWRNHMISIAKRYNLDFGVLMNE